MAVPLKRIFYLNRLAHPVFAEIVRERADVTPQALENASPEAEIAPVLACAHAYQIPSVRDELAPQFHARAALLARSPGLLVVSTSGAAQVAARGAEKVELEPLLRESDFVSVSCPLTDETRGMIGAREYARMPSYACFTTARGGIHDEQVPDGKPPERLLNPQAWPAFAKRFERAFGFAPSAPHT